MSDADIFETEENSLSLQKVVNSFKKKGSVLNEDYIWHINDYKGIQKGEWDRIYSSNTASAQLKRIITAEPKLSKQVFMDYKRLFDIEVKEIPCLDLKEILFEHPEYSKEIFECFNVAANHNTVYYDMRGLCDTLSDIIIEKPEYRDQAFDCYTKAMKNRPHAFNDSMTLAGYRNLVHIALTCQETVDKVLDVFQQDIDTREYSEYDIVNNSTYGELATIIKKYPKSTGKLGFQVFDKAISKAPSGFSLEGAYKALADISEIYPELKEQIKESFDKVLSSDKNNDRSISIGHQMQQKIDISIAKNRVRKNLELNKAMTADIKEGMVKTKESGYKHISRTPSLNKGGREE